MGSLDPILDPARDVLGETLFTALVVITEGAFIVLVILTLARGSKNN